MLPTLLLLALPASGKSEVRRYLGSLGPERAADEFGLGRSVQLDDYPYVHLMRRISEELRHLYESPVFFASDETPFLEAGDWGTLTHLINQDYADLDRTAAARAALGLCVAHTADGSGSASSWAAPGPGRREQWWARDPRPGRGRRCPPTVAGPPRGYGGKYDRSDRRHRVRPRWSGRSNCCRWTLRTGINTRSGQLSHEILSTASVLYVWVTPEESRRRNIERAQPGIGGDASILHHGVPETVMRQDYGTDDMIWLIEQSDRPGTIRVEAHETIYDLPVAVLDNRTDKTSFLRADSATWPNESVETLHHELREAFARLGAPEG